MLTLMMMMMLTLMRMLEVYNCDAQGVQEHGLGSELSGTLPSSLALYQPLFRHQVQEI